ncbi:hypothetical protein CRP235_gp22 [Roseobacter phage CRP-235]|nr:hypothetical protein CRP235_gp22 [Roseobacter phage CRP-235]
MARWRNVNPASYRPKSNALGDALEGFASVYVPATLKKAELEDKRKYEEEKLKKANAAAAAKAAAAQNKKDKKDRDAANAIVARLAGVAGVDASSVTSAGFNTILTDIQTFGADKAFDTYIKGEGTLQVNPSGFFSTSSALTADPVVPTVEDTTAVDPVVAPAVEPVVQQTDALLSQSEDTAPGTVTNTEDTGTGAVDPAPVVVDDLEAADPEAAPEAEVPQGAGPEPLFQTRLPDIMEAKTKYNTPELASEYAAQLRAKADKDSRYAALADSMEKWSSTLSIQNPSFEDLSKLDVTDLAGLLTSPNISDSAKADAQILINTKGKNVPWADITESNYVGFQQQFPGQATQILQVAQANARGIMTVEEMNGLPLAVLKGMQSGANVPADMLASLETVIKEKETEFYRTVSDMTNDKLLGVVNNSLGYDQDVRDAAEQIYAARTQANFNTSSLDNLSVEILRVMENDTNISETNRGLIKEFADAKAKKLEETSKSFRSYAQNVNSVAEARTALDLASSENAPDNVITQLTDLLDNQVKLKTKSDLIAAGFDTAAVIDAVITLEDGTKDYILARRDSEGGLTPVDAELQGKGTVSLMSEVQLDAFKTARTEVQKYSMELAGQNANLAEALRNSELAISIAKNNEMVRNVGGDFAQFLTSTVRGTESVLTVAESLFKGSAIQGKNADNGDPETYITEEQLLAAMKEKGRDQSFLDAIVSQDVQNLADDTARFEATMIILAFRAGRIEGQSGNAMSNKDFERLTQMLETQGSVEAFEQNLRDYMRSKITNYDDSVVITLNTNPNFAGFKQEYGFYPTATPLTFTEFVNTRNEPTLSTSFTNTMNAQPVAPTVQPQPEAPEIVTGIVVTEAMAQKDPRLKDFVGKPLDFQRDANGMFQPVIGE